MKWVPIRQALDAALGLGAEGCDVGDVEILERLSQVSGVLASLELFLDGPVRVVALEHSGAIPVDALRQAMGREGLAQHERP